MYCDQQGQAAEFLYCNTHSVLWLGKGMRQAAMSRHGREARPRHSAGARVTRPQHGHMRCDTTKDHPTTRPTRACDTAAAACDTAAAACDTATRVCSWVRLCTPRCAGWVSRLCTWCTQPVFGLSTISESLIRHCSSQKIFGKFFF